MNNIGIIGLGYVGLTLAVVAALKKINVYGIEINETIKNQINKRVAPFFEPNFDTYLSEVINKNLFVVDEFKENMNLDAIIVTVGTPLNKQMNKPNFNYIKSALDSLKNVYSGEELIVLRSTVSVGVTRSMVIPLLSRLSNKKQKEVLISFCPERTAEGNALYELQSLPQIIGGNNEQSCKLSEQLFSKITSSIVKVASLEAAELVKLFNNVYRDTNFAIGNVFNEIAQQYNLNGLDIIKQSNQGYHRSAIAQPGFVGGPCLEKDSYILTYNCKKKSKSSQFIKEARKYNHSLEDAVVDWVIKKCAVLKINRICISGLAFKGQPSTSDLRGSSSIDIAKKLSEEGFEIYLHDHCVKITDLERMKIGKVFKTIEDMVRHESLLLILNNHVDYKKIRIKELELVMSKHATILDVWNMMLDYDKEGGSIMRYNIGNFLIKDA